MAKNWLAIVFIVLLTTACTEQKGKPIKIGILHSLTGYMASSELPLVDAAILAVEEINKKGGLLGQRLEVFLVDSKSTPEHAAEEADRLIQEKKVSVIFGCWTSSCRKSVKKVVEKHNHLLFYPLQYEGLEHSLNIIYTGAAPNQQVIPSVLWAIDNIGKKIYLVGSDYIFPRTANMIIKDVLKIHGINVLGEKYIPIESKNISSVISDIKKYKPDLILNTINGPANKIFFSALSDLNKNIKVLSYSVAEQEIKNIDAEFLSGHYAAWNYFQSIDSKQNKTFVKSFKKRFGKERVISDPMEATYIGVKLWAQTVNSAGSDKPTVVNQALANQTLNAPEGIVSIDSETRHLWKTVRIGRIQESGQFEIVWNSNVSVRPAPFPSYRNKKYWIKRSQKLLLE